MKHYLFMPWKSVNTRTVKPEVNTFPLMTYQTIRIMSA
nr:hypothetical protein 348p1_00103 [Serratia grimesii]